MAAVGSRGSAAETRIKPGSDAYVGLLGISLLALTAAMVFAFLNWNQISEKPKPVQMAPAAGGGGRMAPPPPGAGIAAPQGAPGAVPPGATPAPPPAGGNAPPPAPQAPQKK